MEYTEQNFIPFLMVGLILIVNLGTWMMDNPCNPALSSAIMSGGALWFIYLAMRKGS
ncbi:hypothetical protein [Sphingorhabdus buctiana]|uniref:hypothetical protein n=1 Tax=Sphingorhabdus buctiana TaxID=1508805 RepID=UPI0036D2C390